MEHELLPRLPTTSQAKAAGGSEIKREKEVEQLQTLDPSAIDDGFCATGLLVFSIFCVSLMCSGGHVAHDTMQLFNLLLYQQSHTLCLFAKKWQKNQNVNTLSNKKFSHTIDEKGIF